MSAEMLPGPAITVHIYTGERVASEYAKFKPAIERALQYDLRGVEHVEILQKLRTGEWLCLSVDEASRHLALLICRVEKARVGTVLEVTCCAGELLRVWQAEAHAALIKVATAVGCRAIRLEGRPGWDRQLKGLNYVCRAVILEHEI
jgi:hypothetical protein